MSLKQLTDLFGCMLSPQEWKQPDLQNMVKKKNKTRKKNATAIMLIVCSGSIFAQN